MGRSAPLPVALPAGWPRRVRSAVLHAISLAHFSLAAARGRAAATGKARRRLPSSNEERLRQEVALLTEELRITGARMRRVPGPQRPHYQPVERLAILELRASRGWSLSQTAERLHLTTATVSSWMRRLDEAGASALVQLRQPVNKFPDFVAYLVQRLAVLLPGAGSVKMAQTLARAGLHLSATTIRRMRRKTIAPQDGTKVTTQSTGGRVTARYAHHAWHCDLTTIPTSLGFWTPWIPFAFPQRWPFCWWIALIADHYTRRIIGFAVFKKQPTAGDVKRFLSRATRRAKARPKYLITDHGSQFIDKAFRNWSRRHGIRQRFGAIGQFGSIALIERLILTVKNECTRRLIVSVSMQEMREELALFCAWYNHERPHGRLAGATPDEVLRGVQPAFGQPRFEPRPHWPRSAPCAGSPATVCGRCGARLDLRVDYLGGRKHLPIVSLKHAA